MPMLSKAGHQVEHVLRDSKRNNAPKSLSVDLLDGRYHSKGENKHDTYEVHVAESVLEYDFIFLMCASWFYQRSRGNLAKKIISKAPRFLLQFLEYSKRGPRVGRRLRLYSGFSDSGWSYAGEPFRWRLV